MSSRIPEPPAPGTVRATIEGEGGDIARFAVFLQAVTEDHSPAKVLADLHLTGITVQAMHGRRGSHIVMTFSLEEADG